MHEDTLAITRLAICIILIAVMFSALFLIRNYAIKLFEGVPYEQPTNTSEYVEEASIEQNVTINGDNNVVAGNIEKFTVNNFYESTGEENVVAAVDNVYVAIAKYAVEGLAIIMLGAYTILRRILKYKAAEEKPEIVNS